MLDLKSTFRYSYQSLSKDELVSREVTIFLGVSEQAAQTGLCPFKPNALCLAAKTLFVWPPKRSLFGRQNALCLAAISLQVRL
jgi:hypothetical protein